MIIHWEVSRDEQGETVPPQILCEGENYEKAIKWKEGATKGNPKTKKKGDEHVH